MLNELEARAELERITILDHIQKILVLAMVAEGSEPGQAVRIVLGYEENQGVN